ncbi:MAG: glycosyltransferase family 4 protein [Rhodospirillales bacterium]|nr:glycosyltransferase family 4 protein [Rhodospirillales bacterium]
MSAIIDFDGKPPEGDKPIGIDVAMREFMRAYFRFADAAEFHCFCPDAAAFETFCSFASEENIASEQCNSIAPRDLDAMEAVGTIIRYDPAILDHAWRRRQWGQRRYSLVGLTHSSASEAVMRVIGDYTAAPLQSWDALICPSEAIRSAIQHILDGWGEYLGDRYSVDVKCPVELPVIPLGIDTARLEHIAREENRNSQREKLGLAADEVAVLYVGRLNYIAKANPQPLLVAVEETAKRSKYPVRLIFNGYFNDSENEAAFDEAIAEICYHAKVTIVRHGDVDYPDGVWAGADIFCSLSDNIQESFGLTPIEAMAAGLPVVVSDWNGYRETVRNEIDGFTIPTLMAPPGTGDDIAFGYFTKHHTYGDYLGAQSQSTAVDAEALVNVLLQLVDNSNLRRAMGTSGRARALEVYDWSRIIPSYEALFAELSHRRQSADELAERGEGQSAHPSHPDPFSMFQKFTTGPILGTGRIELTGLEWEQIIARIGLKTGLIYPNALMELEELPLLIGHLEASPAATVEQITESLSNIDRSSLYRTLVWLIKLGICRYSPSD